MDCLFIGHNEMEFPTYEQTIRQMGIESGAYRDLNLNFVQYQNRLYTISELFNHFFYHGNENGKEHFHLGDRFNTAIAYLGTYLYRRGLNFTYVNDFQNHKDELRAKLKSDDLLTVAIPTTLYTVAFPIIEIVEFIRKYNRKVKIILGGPFVSGQVRSQDDPFSLEYLLRVIGADFYINSSQGEATLVQIIKALKENLPLREIGNLIYFDKGEMITTPLQLEDNHLAENMVDWSLFAGHVGQYAAVRTSISCPFSCAFCGFPQHAGRYQTTPPELIEAELNSLEKLGTVTSVSFVDDTFNVPPDRFKEILRMMIKNKYSFKWNSYLRCQYIDEETVALMKESGCEGVFLGIESGSPQILQNMNKGATLEKYRRGIELLKQHDILTYASFIIGFPGETDETIQETIRFIEETQPTFFRTQLWYCDPITPIWKESDQYQIKGSQFEWSHATMDSKKACDWIDQIFCSVQNSIWLPQYNMEFFGVFHLLHRGLSVDQMKQFIQAFDAGVREKFTIPHSHEVSPDVVQQLADACGNRNDTI